MHLLRKCGIFPLYYYYWTLAKTEATCLPNLFFLTESDWTPTLEKQLCMSQYYKLTLSLILEQKNYITGENDLASNPNNFCSSLYILQVRTWWRNQLTPYNEEICSAPNIASIGRKRNQDLNKVYNPQWWGICTAKHTW